MIHFRARCDAALAADALRSAFAERELAPQVTPENGGIAVALGRWGTIRLRLVDPAVHLYEADGLASAGSLAHTIAAVLCGGLVAAAVFEPDGALLAVEERLALRGPLITNDTEARAALDALGRGHITKLSQLALYVSVFIPRESASPLRRDLIAWCVREGAGTAEHAVRAATVAASFGGFPAARAALPAAEAAFEPARRAREAFERER